MIQNKRVRNQALDVIFSIFNTVVDYKTLSGAVITRTQFCYTMLPKYSDFRNKQGITTDSVRKEKGGKISAPNKFQKID